jgi:TIR domain
MDAPKIFISYAHADLKAAETIASALARANLKAFFDLNSLSPGQTGSPRFRKRSARPATLWR